MGNALVDESTSNWHTEVDHAYEVEHRLGKIHKIDLAYVRKDYFKMVQNQNLRRFEDHEELLGTEPTPIEEQNDPKVRQIATLMTKID
jgi:hypothetical protein